MVVDETASAAYNPFFVPEDRFRSRIATIALCPLALHSPETLPHEYAVKDRFDSAITALLSDSGYAVVPSRKVQQALSRAYACTRVPDNGSPGKAGEHSLKEEFYRELGTAYHADAVLYPEIIVVQADYTSGTARWCGAAQKVSTSGRAAIELLTGSGYGKVPAFSILVHVHDMDGRRIFGNAAGIEILQKIGAYRRVPVPAGRLLNSRHRIRRAIETALKPLVGSRRGAVSIQL